MFRHSSSAPSYGDASYMQAALATVPTQIPRSTAVGGYCFDGGNAVNGAAFPPFAAAASSPPSTYSSSAYYNNIHRSISAHSLPLHIQLGDNLNGGGAFFSSSSPSPHQLSLPPMSSSPSSSCGDLYDFTSSSCSVRRVFSTGDLQGMNVNGSSPVPSGDGCGQDAAGGGPFSQKVGRYSAEERKERVERYRLKRHQRNFTKKITYACRKSLADSRPRVKGRFARNGEAEAEADDREASDNSYDYYGYSDPSNQSTGNSRYHGQHAKDDSSVSADAAAAAFVVGAGDNGDWWWRAPGAEGQRQVGFDVDEELWATLGDMLSVNLAS